MKRLTEKDKQGNWGLRGVTWGELQEELPRELLQKLYGALWKLMEYEETGLNPEGIEKLKEFEGSNTQKYLIELEKHRWIPVEEERPPFGQRLQATILHHEWIADYDSYCVPEAEKTYHPAYMEVCEIYPMGAMWCYSCEEDDYNSDVAYINPVKDLSMPVAEIIAWRPLPESYRPGKDGEEHGRS